MIQTHLSYGETTNLGSFYTPRKVVRLVAEMIRKNVGTVAFPALPLTVIDSSCGSGAYFSPEMCDVGVPVALFVGGDVDGRALEIAARTNPLVSLFETNALSDVSREKYAIAPDEPLLIVGNPPYNDVTSRVKSEIKTSAPLCEIDADVKTRDLGLSFLLSFVKLHPDFIAVLHPLSYLIKPANFRTLAPFFARYALADSLVLNSQEFSGTSRGNGFPILIVFYKKSTRGWTYRDVEKMDFLTLDGHRFSLSEFDYIRNYISKYPSHRAFPPREREFKFFTMRDINALKRSRTFIVENSANAVSVPANKLEYYCYVDVFKDFAGWLPYYLGNFDVMINHEEFLKLKHDFLTLSVVKHPQIFKGKVPAPSADEISASRERVRNYFSSLFERHAHVD